MRRLLFSLTKKDFRVDTFRAGGHGGQNQNKTESGVRITHIASGAIGECRETPSQHQNRKTAFRRLTETPKFKLWHKITCATLLGHKTVAEMVEEDMDPKNIRVEVRDDKNEKWIGDINVRSNASRL